MMVTMGKKTTRTHVSVRINSHLLEQLDAMAEHVGRTRSDLIDRAIEAYLSSVPQAQKPAIKPTSKRS